MGNLQKLSEADFDSEALGQGSPVLVDFYADWCGPCRAMAPVVEQIATEMADQIKVAQLDTDASPSIAMRYGIMSIPTLMIFHNGQRVDQLVGYPGPAGVKSWVASSLAKVAS